MRFRTFIALDVEPFTCDRLAGLQKQLVPISGAVRWVEPYNFHLTLIFMGEVDARDTLQVCRVVEQVATPFAPFQYTLAGLSAFPNPRRPRTLIAKVENGADEIKALHAALQPALLELGDCRREERVYTPHVTLGRVGRDGDPEALAAALTKFGAWRGGHSQVREVKVLSSAHSSDGPEYAVLGRARLTG